MSNTEDRISLLRDKMRANSIDLVALGPGAHMKWLLGYQPHADERPCLLCVSSKSAALLMPGLNAQSAREHTSIPFFEWADANGPVDAFTGLLNSLAANSASNIVLDETMRADFAALVQDALPQAHRQFTTSTLGALRMCKDDKEHASLKANALIADKAMQAGWSAMHVGMSELEVAEVIQQSFSSQNATPLFTIIATGPNSAFPHHHTGSAVLKSGDAVVMDIGAGMDDYSSDITRMAIIGQPPEDYFEVHGIVNDAVDAAMQIARPGITAKEVDKAARDVITDAGYGEFFIHRTGHGVGVEIHEPPYLSANSEEVLLENSVFSIEPGIYLPKRFGIRLEEIVILRESGPEILSELPRDTAIID